MQVCGFFSALIIFITFIIIQFSRVSRLPILHPFNSSFTTTFEKDAIMDIALSQVTKLEGIAMQDNGNYRQFTELQDFVSAVRSIGTLEKNCTDALAAWQELLKAASILNSS